MKKEDRTKRMRKLTLTGRRKIEYLGKKEDRTKDKKGKKLT